MFLMRLFLMGRGGGLSRAESRGQGAVNNSQIVFCRGHFHVIAFFSGNCVGRGLFVVWYFVFFGGGYGKMKH